MATIRMAARHWDHLSPIALGDVAGSERYTLERRDLTPNLWNEPNLDVAETSFSRYVQARAAGDDRVIALPVFVMRGFRHRCIITKAESPLDSAEALCGKRIGLTGWGDSGIHRSGSGWNDEKFVLRWCRSSTGRLCQGGGR